MTFCRVGALIASCLTIGCSDFGIDPDPVRPGQISFEKYEVGQSNRYVHFFASGDIFYGPQPPASYFRPDTIVYQPDTLITEIVALTASGFEMVERYSTGSSVFHDTTAAGQGLGELHVTVRIQNGGVTFTGQSRLLRMFLQFSLSPTPLPLRQIYEPETHFKSWRATIYPNAERYVQGCVRDYTQLGRKYYILNVIIDTSMGNGCGATAIYSAKQGIVRVLYEYQASPMEGWDLL